MEYNKDSQKRIEKEAEIYDNQSLKRNSLRRIMSHVKNGPAVNYERNIVRNMIGDKGLLDFLEIGTTKWQDWISTEKTDIDSLVCINISEKEIDKGRKLASEVDMNAEFKLADAHSLPFSNESFDVVFGGSIIHHLDIPTAIEEIHRVLRPGGLILFSEPLGVNPVGMFVRYLTPEARTPDERPLYPKDLRLIECYFEADRYYLQLFEVLGGLISRHIFDSPNNILTNISHNLDMGLFYIPYVGLLSRKILISGTKKQL